MLAANSPIAPANPTKLGVCALSGAALEGLAEAEVEVSAAIASAEAAEAAESWLAYNDPRGLISN